MNDQKRGTLIRKRIIRIAGLVLLLWLGAFALDCFAVSCLHRSPVFCVQHHEKTHFSGLGYSFDAYAHPISGAYAYVIYVFGCALTSTMTNAV